MKEGGREREGHSSSLHTVWAVIDDWREGMKSEKMRPIKRGRQTETKKKKKKREKKEKVVTVKGKRRRRTERSGVVNGRRLH